MAEKKDRYDAFIYPSWKLEIENIEDNFEKSIVEHEFPYKDGAMLEDMGEKARQIRFRCYFYNGNYESHIELINFLKQKDLIEMSHPKYGIVEGKVKTISVRHDYKEKTAEIDIAFVENLRGEIEVQAYVDVQMAGEEAYVNGWSDMISDFELDAKNELGPQAEGILKKELDPSKSTMLEQFTNLTTPARGWIKKVDTYVKTMQGTLNKISNPANSITSMLKFSTNLPGTTIGSVAKTVERYGISLSTLRSSPARFVSSYVGGMKGLEKSSGSFSKYTKIGGALGCGLHTSQIFKSDQLNQNAMISLAKAKSFDALGRFLK
ncbi:MAG: mu-like prophage DNA circulation protein [Nitrospirae bacterium]|nr:MAG: mu-like prophage DNA circulation protein [Nitrospirota bacterium]